jgi:molybdate transport system substrate-binding protein
MHIALKGISSMATRAILADLGAAYQQRTGVRLAIESVGGVDAARRVQSGEVFDAVFLASDAIDKLIGSAHVLADSKIDLMRSGVAVAVRLGAVPPDISSEQALRAAVRAAPSIGYSTGPSGVALGKLFERWGIVHEIESRIVQAAPGVPVGALVAQGKVALGFQQYSELMNLEGIVVLGPMPPPVQITTTFSAAVCSLSAQVEAVRDVLAFMASSETAKAKRSQGMEPA